MYLVTTGMIQGKCFREKQREKMLIGQTKSQNDALKPSRDRNAWRVMIAYTKEQGTWFID